MFDLLDIFAGKFNNTFTGSYYEKMPDSPDITGVAFDYEHIDPNEWHYQRMFSNVTANQAASTAIKTNDNLNFKAGAFMALQNGKFYEIVSVQEDYQSAEKEVFRYLAIAPGVDFVIRLIEKDNPWGLQ